ncbi:NAD(P)-dependent alcohol dehydrogenase [Pelagicoccus enzymogenes]|uniref:NAD(P)-dependent alcohol dehydrogenase n=1 Tax=Pelagicoccus enzymogenes TaxID=2773457 RepID=UPI00280D6BEE|nr:NAD(P)-dependent alcohol dehydrogenase [Pelagicoccus enzymogenes]MDQ8198159.1 NAD(P)-dependent alcohol dehydrogenase [Pelagicoccus enzymogenes]
MKALVLEKVGQLALREIEIEESLGPRDVRVDIRVVGICGSDVHYYQHGSIGPFVVEEPMVLGHEAAGVVAEVGKDVRSLKVGDRVCMEPGIPNLEGRATRLGMYNLDPDVRFWATPPVHGCLRDSVVHPEAFTFKLPDPVSFAEGAMVEPLAVGMHAANKARIKPGDVAVVLGAGPIGMLTALSALAGGCSRVFISDIQDAKLEIAAKLGSVVPVNVSSQSLTETVLEATAGWGADIVFDAVGVPNALSQGVEALRPGGCLALIGMPGKAIPFDVVAAQVKEVRIETVFRYAHVYPRALELLGSGAIEVAPLITDRYPFSEAVEAFDYACKPEPRSVKVQIEL